MSEQSGQARMSDVCSFIADWFNYRKRAPQVITGHDVFHYSPTGELFMVWQWWTTAKQDADFMATQDMSKLQALGIAQSE